MNLKQRISDFAALGDYILQHDTDLEQITHKAFVYNNWFSTENTHHALKNIAQEFLNKAKLEHWLQPYIEKIESNKVHTIAIVAAGNIPMVAFHDILCILISGNKLQIKLSEKDKFLLPFLFDKLIAINPVYRDYIEIKERLENFDAIIATGSNNTAKYFEHYFGKYKNIIRKNRNSIAILTGNESEQDLENLGHDIFDYFGLGCRNVSKIFVPKNYDVTILKNGLEAHRTLMQHTSYMNNLDYQRTIYLMNQIPLVDIDFINIVENKSLHSPISCLHLERYDTVDEVNNFIIDEQKNIQCIIGKDYIPFGKSQQPSLSDYADNIDTMQFILN